MNTVPKLYVKTGSDLALAGHCFLSSLLISGRDLGRVTAFLFKEFIINPRTKRPENLLPRTPRCNALRAGPRCAAGVRSRRRPHALALSTPPTPRFLSFDFLRLRRIEGARERPAPRLCKAARLGVAVSLDSVSLRAGGRPRRASACEGGHGGAPSSNIMVSMRGKAGKRGALRGEREH